MDCRKGSCQRHRSCMYSPCFAKEPDVQPITTETPAAVVVVQFSAPLPGHWDTDEAAEMANRSVVESRADLMMGDLSDFALANAQYLVSRSSLALVHYQTAAKERLRWLSAHLAKADIEITRLRAENAELQRKLDEAARLAECAFDDRGNSRAGHHSEMDWTDGFRDGTRAAASAIRASIRGVA